MDAEPAKQPAEHNEGRPEKRVENPASSDRGVFEDPENGRKGRSRIEAGVGFSTPARAAKKGDFAKKGILRPRSSSVD